MLLTETRAVMNITIIAKYCLPLVLIKVAASYV